MRVSEKVVCGLRGAEGSGGGEIVARVRRRVDGLGREADRKGVEAVSRKGRRQRERHFMVGTVVSEGKQTASAGWR